MAPNSAVSYEGTFNRVQLLLKPLRLAEINSIAVSQFQKRLREVGVNDRTICKHLRQLKAAMRWAKSMEMIARVPEFHFPKNGRHQSMMKGRPITDDEFQRMLNAVESVVGADAAPSWKFFLEGLWWSGLRLAEALNLTWHPSEKLYVRFDCELPMLSIRAEGEKGRKDRLLPMAPEFAKLLQAHGIADRGHVFGLTLPGSRRNSLSSNWVSKIGSQIGKVAGVVVKNEAGGNKRAKYASLHDLRRSFGDRWSRIVMPQDLMTLMRHEAIETTMRFYVGQNAERLAKKLWHKMEHETA